MGRCKYCGGNTIKMGSKSHCMICKMISDSSNVNRQLMNSIGMMHRKELALLVGTDNLRVCNEVKRNFSIYCQNESWNRTSSCKTWKDAWTIYEKSEQYRRLRYRLGLGK